MSPRRATAAVLVVLATTTVGIVGRSGVAVPQLSWTGGGGVEVSAAGREDGIAVRQFVSVHNDGWVDATVTGLALPELAGVQWGEAEGLPRQLAPGQAAEIAINLQVDGCGVVVDGYDVVPLRARVGFLPSVVIEVGAPLSHAPARYETGRVQGGATEGMVRAQPPSWILDAISWPCTDGRDS